MGTARFVSRELIQHFKQWSHNVPSWLTEIDTSTWSNASTWDTELVEGLWVFGHMSLRGGLTILVQIQPQCSFFLLLGSQCNDCCFTCHKPPPPHARLQICLILPPQTTRWNKPFLSWQLIQEKQNVRKRYLAIVKELSSLLPLRIIRKISTVEADIMVQWLSRCLQHGRPRWARFKSWLLHLLSDPCW